jgi:acyl dehydratase
MTTGGQGSYVSGPYFEDLEVGQLFGYAPPLTLTDGLAAAHQAIVGDRLRLALDAELATAVTGDPSFAHPALVWNVAIGQSTIVTQHVKANLFYRGLAFHHAPRLGDTLRTTTEIVGLRQNQPKEGRAATGLAALRITTLDQRERKVLDFSRSGRVDRTGRRPRRHRRRCRDRLRRPVPRLEARRLRRACRRAALR